MSLYFNPSLNEGIGLIVQQTTLHTHWTTLLTSVKPSNNSKVYTHNH